MINLDLNNFSVQKIGGSCLSSKESMLYLKAIEKDSPTILVVSAFYSITDKLQACLDLAGEAKSYQNIMSELFDYHLSIIDGFSEPDQRIEIIAEIKQDLNQIDKVLNSLSVVAAISDTFRDYVLSFGEKWSALLINSYLKQQGNNSTYINAKNFLYVNKAYGKAEIDWNKSEKSLKEIILNSGAKLFIVTGFIASDESGNIITLGRNGTDYSASIVAKLLKSKELIFWKDVGSVLSADPKIVKSAFALEKISYEEAMEMAHFGSSVLHPKSIYPAAESNIPVRIKSFFKPEEKGTLISGLNDNSRVVKAVSHISGLSLITVEGNGLQSSTFLNKYVFTCLDEFNIHVYLNTQASSEYSICFAIKTEDRENVVKLLKARFSEELSRGSVKRISYLDSCSLIAVIGDNMIGKPGIVAKFSRLLAQASINITAIAQGASERNISIVIDKKNLNRALRLVHSSFLMEQKKIDIAVIGTGLIGSQLLKLIENEKTNVLKQGIVLNIKAALNSKDLYIAKNNSTVLDKMKAGTPEKDSTIKNLLSYFDLDESPNMVLFDCSASREVAELYPRFMEKGFHLITANKIANSMEMSKYRNLRKLSEQLSRKFFYETNVGAALPIIDTIKSFLNSGDEIYRIEGVFSGSLSYIFKKYTGEKSFASVVKDAQELGYTEPDPRNDLNGLDMLRKLIILIRESAYTAEFNDVKFESLLEENDNKLSLEAFYQKLETEENKYFYMLNKAKKKDCKLSYYASFDCKKGAKLGIIEIDQNHPASRMQAGDNIFIIYSKRYHKLPFILQGPGAGAEITASGLYSDLLKLCSTI